MWFESSHGKKYATHRGKIHRHFSLAHTGSGSDEIRSFKISHAEKKRAGSAVALSHRRVLLQTQREGLEPEVSATSTSHLNQRGAETGLGAH